MIDIPWKESKGEEKQNLIIVLIYGSLYKYYESIIMKPKTQNEFEASIQIFI